MFVLHGNVFDAVVHQQRTLTITSFLTDVLLKDSRQTVAVYNLATGVRFVRREAGGPSFDDALLATEKPKALAALERVLVGASKVAVILEYAEAIAPAGDPAFQADSDRAAIITLQRWSFLPEVDRSDNLVLLIAENLSELSPKLVSNPKVGVVEVPMPDADARRAAIRLADPTLTDKDVDRYAEVTAGLKAIQIASILAPPPASEGDARDREAFIAGILAGSADAEARAHKLVRPHRRPVARRNQETAGPRGARPDGRGGQRGRPGPGRGRPADRPAQAGDPRARVLRPGGVRRAGARLRGRRRHGGSEEGPAGRRREHSGGADQPGADGHPLHRSDGHRARRSWPRRSPASAA